MAENPYRIHIRQGEFELDVEGDRAFVEAYIEAFLAEEGMIEAEPAVKSKKAPAAKPAKVAAKPAGKRAGKRAAGRGGRPTKVPEVNKAALRSFMGKRGPSSNKDRYLEYVRFWKSQGVNEVADAYIHACFVADGLPIPPTGRQNFSTLRDAGLITTGSRRGYWKLTESGEKGAPSAKRGRAAKKAAKRGPKKAAAKPRRAKAKKPGPKPGRKPGRRRRAPKTVAEVMGG